MKFLREKTKPQINNTLYSSTFKMNLHIHEEPEELYCKHVINLLKDLFPYLQLYSITNILVITEIIINLFIAKETLSIKPYFLCSELTPWILCPFACPNMPYLFCHVVFMLMVGSELEKVLKKPQKYVVVYFTFSVVANLLSKLLFIQPSSVLATSTSDYNVDEGTFAIYIYLYLIHNRQALPQYELDMQNFHNDNNDSKIQGLYKCIFVSYLVYGGTYGLQGTHYSIYIIGLIICVSFSFLF